MGKIKKISETRTNGNIGLRNSKKLEIKIDEQRANNDNWEQTGIYKS